MNKLDNNQGSSYKIVHPKFSGGNGFGNLRPMISDRGAERMKYSTAAESATKTLLTNSILRSLAAPDFAQLKPHLEPVTLGASEELCAPGEPHRYVYFPLTAVVSHLCVTANGDMIEAAMIGAEGASGVCGLFGNPAASHQAQTIGSGSAVRVKIEALRQEFERGKGLHARLLEYVNAYVGQISQRVICQSFHLTEKRLSSWLLMLHDRLKKNQFAATQEQISLHLGVNRPSLTLIAQALRNKGLIEYRRGKVEILNRLELEKAACECYRFVH
jgi:CRP-like cAMP-binding protein